MSNLKFYKEKLEKKKEEFYNNYANNRDMASPRSKETSGDLVDRATSDYAKEFLNNLSASDLKMLGLIDEALVRIGTDDYGVCLDCGDDINPKRLKAVPWAKLCINCQESKENAE
jgi:DnaK suppressor protein